MKKWIVSRVVAVCLILGMVVSQTGCVAEMMAAGSAIGGAVGAHNGRPEYVLVGMAAGLLAGLVGQEMQKYDQQRLQAVYYSGQATGWTNPETGNTFQATPWGMVQPGTVEGTAGYRACREAQIKAWINGTEKISYATACDDGSGGWKLVASR